MIKAWLVIIALMGGIALIKNYWSGYRDDNVVEELIEHQIKTNTGKDIDLTPMSEEKA